MTDSTSVGTNGKPPNLDNQIAEIETGDGTILKTQGAGTISLQVLIGSEQYAYPIFANVQYNIY